MNSRFVASPGAARLHEPHWYGPGGFVMVSDHEFRVPELGLWPSMILSNHVPLAGIPL